jgi:hypothetical protein
MSNEDYRGLSRALLELNCERLNMEERAANQLVEGYRNLFRRVSDLAAREATTEPARALPAPAPVASGSGQLVLAPALPGPSERCSALGPTRDREPGVERSVHTRTRRTYGGPARNTPGPTM